MNPKAPNRLLIALLLGITSGILLGGMAPEAGKAVQFLGDVFLKALFLMVVPLVMSSIIVGVSSLGDVRKLGPLGGRTVLYFMATTGLAVVIGLALVLIIQPGAALEKESAGIQASHQQENGVSERMVDKPTTIGALLRTVLTGLVPQNLFAAMANAEVLPLIIFSLVFGAVLTTLGERGQLVIRFF
ncbi:MAG: cation:dicarboxylase symporter family transporter, partial [Nitrospirae bacterium]|nr:cation:dicarboxylase symporter family transporter [Nitrospirota bacterium]